MNLGLIHASYSLPEWQAVKLFFFFLTLWFVDLLYHDVWKAALPGQ